MLLTDNDMKYKENHRVEEGREGQKERWWARNEVGKFEESIRHMSE